MHPTDADFYIASMTVARLFVQRITTGIARIYRWRIAESVICCCTSHIETLGLPLRWGTPHAVMRGGDPEPGPRFGSCAGF